MSAYDRRENTEELTEEELYEYYPPAVYDDIRTWRDDWKMTKLTPAKRDELLIRLDERVKDLKEEDIPEIKEALKTQNGRIRKNTIAIAAIIGSGVLGGGVFGLIKLLV